MDIPQDDENYNNGFWKLNKAIYELNRQVKCGILN